MSSREFLDKFKKVESDIAAEKGDFALFALFLREDVPDRWDLIVSAPYASSRENADLKYFVDRIQKDVGDDALTFLSRIVFVDPHNISVQNLNRAINVEHGSVEVQDSNFFGLPIKHAFIITSKALGAHA